MADFTPISAAIGGALIGLSAVLLMLLNGRIAGITGVFAGLIDPTGIDRAWRATFIAGLIVGCMDRFHGCHAEDADELHRDRGSRPSGRLRYAAEQRMHVRAWRLWHRAVIAALTCCDWRVHGCGDGRRGAVPARVRRLTMRALAGLLCGFIFGWGLFVSGMMRTEKVLGFLDVLAIPSGKWDPSLAVVMIAALVVTGAGYALARRRTPVFETQNQWPAQTTIDRPLITGSVLFGIGWGLVGLCPGPAIANLATLSSPVIVFVVAMAVGTLVHDLWYARGSAPDAPSLAQAKTADG
jgi:uncharacterized protein